MRSLAFLLLAAFAVLTFALHRGAGPAAAEPPRDLRLSSIASELTRRNVSIRCEGTAGRLTRVGGESGRTSFVDGRPGDTSFLQAGICERLHRYAKAKSRFSCLLPCAAPLELAWSLNALVHESYHLAGVRNEAQTECYALQAIDFAARRLGAGREQARALAGFAFEQLPRRMPPAYSSPECRNNGRYDLRPGDPVWP